MEYQYPFSYDWSTDEVIDVVDFFQSVEKAYETGIVKDEFMEAYRKFKKVVPGKGDEKKICNEFEEVSGYSAYRTLEKIKKTEDNDTVKM